MLSKDYPLQFAGSTAGFFTLDAGFFGGVIGAALAAALVDTIRSKLLPVAWYYIKRFGHHLINKYKNRK